jgi:hypothetical protein
MNEQEYIDATNLAKLRIMRNFILNDCLPMTEEEKLMEREIAIALRKWIEHLEPKVREGRSDER